MIYLLLLLLCLSMIYLLLLLCLSIDDLPPPSPVSVCLSDAGIYLFATEDQASITEAFGKVAQLIIQEQILIEEY